MPVDQVVRESLVVPLMTIVGRELMQCSTQVSCAERNETIQEFRSFTERTVPHRGAVRRPRRRPTDANTSGANPPFHTAAPFRIPNERLVASLSIVFGALATRRSRRARRPPADADFAPSLLAIIGPYDAMAYSITRRHE